MREQFEGWQRSSHRSVAVCNDCHAPHDFVGKYMTKARNGFWHSFYFTTGTFHEPIRITPRNAAVTEGACRFCHAEIVHAIDTFPGRGRWLSCIELPSQRRASPLTWQQPRFDRARLHALHRAGRRARRGWRHGPARQHLRAQAGSPKPLLPGRRAHRPDRRPGDLGQELPAAVRRLPPHGGPGADALRRQRSRAAHADPGRPALGRRAVAARGGPAAEDDVGRLCVCGRLPRRARPRLHARRPDLHRAAARREAAGHVHALPRVGLSALQEARRRRSDQGLRGDEPDAVHRSPQAGVAPGGVPRLPRFADDAAAGHAAGVHRGHPGREGRPGHGRLRRQHDGDQAGDAGVRVRPVPRGVLLQGT